MPKRISKSQFSHPFDRNELIKIAVDTIKKNPYCFKVTNLIPLLPFGRKAWDNHNLNDVTEIHELLDKNKISKKMKKLKDLDKSENAAAQIAFMKIVADNDELASLRMEKEESKIEKKDNTLKI